MRRRFPRREGRLCKNRERPPERIRLPEREGLPDTRREALVVRIRAQAAPSARTARYAGATTCPAPRLSIIVMTSPLMLFSVVRYGAMRSV